MVGGDKGKYIATTKVNGQELAGQGSTEWLAQHDLKRKIAILEKDAD